MRKIKILLATDSFYPSIGGMETVIYNLANGLSRRGHEVSVLVNLRRFPFKHYEELSGIKIYRVKMGIFNWNFRSVLGFMRQTPGAILRIRQILKKEEPEIVNLHFITSGAAAYVRFFQKFFQYKFVASAHGADIFLMPYQSKSYLKLAQRVIEQSDAVTACSNNLLENMVKLTATSAGKSTAIYNGINNEDFKYVSEDCNFIFSAQRLVYEKGVDILMQSFKIVKDRGFTGGLVVAGDGPEKGRILSLISSLGLEDSVTLAGMFTSEQVNEYIRKCTFVVVPSRSEAFGLINLEAMASGKAIVASNIGGIPELVRGGYNGLLFKAEDHLDLAEKMIFMINNKAFRYALAENGKRFVNAKFSWSKMVDSYEQLYYRMLAK